MIPCTGIHGCILCMYRERADLRVADNYRTVHPLHVSGKVLGAELGQFFNRASSACIGKRRVESVAGSDGALSVCHVVHERDDDQGEQGRHRDAEYERPGKAGENRVERNGPGREHGRERG